MVEQLKWEDIYAFWKTGSFYLPEILSEPVIVENVFVEYKHEGYIYGYDWIETERVQQQKILIEKNPIGFLYFTKPTNKGTIQTAEMLVEAKNEEELAAIWIAATAKELCERDVGEDVERYANKLYWSACGFLRERYCLWHHAMKKLVPEIMIPQSVLRNVICENAEPVIGLIQMNTMLIKNNWSILRYSSLIDNEFLGDRYRLK